MGRRADLDTVIAEQAAELERESRSAKLPRHRGTVRFSELPPAGREDAEAGGGRRRRHVQPRQWAVYLFGCDPHDWDACNHLSNLFMFDPKDGHAADHIKAHFREQSFPINCPVCMGRTLPEGWYCMACDRAGLDPMDADPSIRFRYKGEPIGSRDNPEYVRACGLNATKLRPDPAGLKGGND